MPGGAGPARDQPDGLRGGRRRAIARPGGRFSRLARDAGPRAARNARSRLALWMGERPETDGK